MWSDGARGAEISAHAGDQEVPIGGKDSEMPLRDPVRRRRIARRLIQRARRRAFRQEASVKAEGRVARMEDQITALTDQVATLSNQIGELLKIFDDSFVATTEIATQTLPTQTRSIVEATTQTIADSVDAATCVHFATLLNSVCTQTSDVRTTDSQALTVTRKTIGSQTPTRSPTRSSQDPCKTQADCANDIARTVSHPLAT